MKLWLVLFVAGKVSGSWGPLPYDMAECEVRRAERQQAIESWVSTGINDYGKPIPADIRENLKGWKMQCVEAEQRPALEEN